MELPPANILIPLERQLIALQLLLTDGIAVASTALAMRALQRAVKIKTDPALINTHINIIYTNNKHEMP